METRDEWTGPQGWGGGGGGEALTESLLKERERKCVPYIFPSTHKEGFAAADRLKFACFRLFFSPEGGEFSSALSTSPFFFFLFFQSVAFQAAIL